MARGKFVANLIAFLAGLGLVLALLEAVLRFLPVNEGSRVEPVNAESPIIHLQPNRTFTWSKFADFSMVNRVHANNYGFVNDQDYDPAAPLPLLAVIGDSFVEAAMVPYAETGHGRLAAALRGRMRVYSFGASGAALSQYLAYSDYARQAFAPRKLVVVVVGNDFDESLLTYKSTPGLHSFQRGPDGGPELVRLDFEPSLWVRLARHSRLALYLAHNLEIGALPQRLGQLLPARRNADFVGQTDADATPDRLADGRWAADAFLALLPGASGLAPRDILLVVDGARPSLYSPEELRRSEGSFFAQMRRHLLDRARERGFRTVDMETAFREEYRRGGRRFEFENDGHWNALGHEVFFREVLRSGLLDDLS